jgi:hypothetical protein
MFKMLSKGHVFVIGALLVQLLKPSPCYSQQTEPDTTFLSRANKKSIARYSQAIQHQSRLFNGSDYVVYIPEEDEHPYFKSDDWVVGSIVYWDEPYDSVSLLYDLSIDQVIAEHEGGNPIKLIGEKVQRFSILDYTFVRLERDRDNNISEGFYGELYAGNIKVYAKYLKRLQETIVAQTITPRFDENTRYYIFKNGSYHFVRNKGSVLEVFNDRKQAVKEFIRKNHIRFKNNREEAIRRIAEFYDTSSTQ